MLHIPPFRKSDLLLAISRVTQATYPSYGVCLYVCGGKSSTAYHGIPSPTRAEICILIRTLGVSCSQFCRRKKPPPGGLELTKLTLVVVTGFTR